MPEINVGIIDDHQSIIDGYSFRLEKDENIKVVGAGSYGEDIAAIFSENHIDVLLLDISVPSSRTNQYPYPILHIIPKLLEDYAALSVIVISMHNRKTLIKSIMDTGASGYILKDDKKSIENLAQIVKTVYHDGVYFSKKTYALLKDETDSDELPKITKRQKEILNLCAANPNWKTKHIADAVNLAPSTVRNTLHKLYIALDVPNLRSAVDYARSNHMITPYSSD